MENLKSSLDKKKNELSEIQSRLHEYLLNVPNILIKKFLPGKMNPITKSSVHGVLCLNIISTLRITLN